MAEHVILPSCTKLQLQKSFFKQSHFVPKNVCFRVVQRSCKKHCYGNFKLRVSPRDVRDFNANTAMILGRSVPLNESPTRSCCFGTLVNPDNTAASNWIPVLDQVLMMVSMVLAHIAGVVPPDNVYNTPANMPNLDAVPPSSSSGSAAKSDNQVNVEYAWVEVKGKLLGALDTVQQNGRFDEGVVDYEKYSAKGPLSLSAIAESPRLRLLWETLQQLEKEVSNVSGSCHIVDRGDWIATSARIIQNSSQSVFVKWLEEELYLENKKHDKDVLLAMVEKLKGDDNILKNIRRSGKEDLYADLLFHLRFHVLGMGCRYDIKLIANHGVDILEDLVITLADGITSNYLELISVDSNMSGEMNCLGLNLCSMSTRALQKLRNEVALNQWLIQNMDSVVSMYEDRFDLYNFQIKLTKEPSKRQQDIFHWWKKFMVKKPSLIFPPVQYMVICPLSMSVKRTKELRALNGWRYYFSLFLEFSDITMPWVKVIFAKICSAISFLLVCLVGRSLGLIYSGIRQSLGWRGGNA